MPCLHVYLANAVRSTALRLDRQAAREYPRKGRVKEKYYTEWVAEIDYRGYKLTLLTQIADMLLQLYEKGSPGLREAKRSIKRISSDLLKSSGEPLTGEDKKYTGPCRRSYPHKCE